MPSTHFRRESLVTGSPEELFDWHCAPGAFERLSPPWEDVRLLRHPEGLAEGAEVEIELRTWPARHRWLARIDEVEPGRAFRDVQLSGPFAAWEHTHSFEPAPAGKAVLRDEIRYKLPLGAVADTVAGGFVERKLHRLFAFRHRITERDLQRRRRLNMTPMTIAITGASGLIGRALVPLLKSGGHRIVSLVRRPANGPDEVHWNPESGFPDGVGALGECDAVIHLAGENIAGGRWTRERKARIRDSRVNGTRTLCQALAKLERKPRVLVSSSAIGYYGETGESWADEDSPRGTGFLPEVSVEWERQTQPARHAGIRVGLARTGIVLSPQGGALEKMLPLFRAGLGAPLGNGRQYMSWISIEDEIGALLHCIGEESLHGPVNLVAPNPVTNREFTRVLARLLGRPVIPPAPGFALRLLYGSMADEALLRSTRVRPSSLMDSGYEFAHTHLEDALREVLGLMEEG